MSFRSSHRAADPAAALSDPQGNAAQRERLQAVLAVGHAHRVAPTSMINCKGGASGATNERVAAKINERVAVKIMGSKTVPMDKTRSDEETVRAWDYAMSRKIANFDWYYAKLQDTFPGKSFDFFTDGDPPDKEDDWKMFTAYVSMKDGNTLTITKTDDSKRGEKIQKWERKGVKKVKFAVAPNGPLKYTLDATQAVVAMNIVPKTHVFDKSFDNPMRDGDNFQYFQIKAGCELLPRTVHI